MTRKILIFSNIILSVALLLALGSSMVACQPTRVMEPDLHSEETTAGSIPDDTSAPEQSDPLPSKPAETEPEETEPPKTEPPETELPNERYTVCIDAGHQQNGIFDKEPNGPGSSEMKIKLASGTKGVATGTPEYQLTLEVSVLLEQELIARGYNVIMIRRSNDCPLSNAERAVVANESGADIFVRIHANGSENTTVSGMLCCAPTKNNPYLSQSVIDESIRLSRAVVEKFCAATGAKKLGLYSVDTMTGINWCQIPVTIVEMGFMSNPEEDRNMATDEYRTLMVQGMADGIDAYFSEE